MLPEAYELMESLESSHWWFRARREIICATIARYVAAGGQIIDFGCGTGGTAAALHDLGFRVVAADVSQRALAACQAKALPTIDLASKELPASSADCVLAGDILEHVEDDVGLLRTLREALRPSGYFIGTVPAYEFLWSGEDYVSQHFRRYTRGALKAKLRAAGYDVVWCSYFNTLLFPLVSTVIMSNRLFRPRAMYQSNVRPHPAWQNRILYRLFVTEKKLLRWLRFPFGVSVIAVARAAGAGPAPPAASGQWQADRSGVRLDAPG